MGDTTTSAATHGLDRLGTPNVRSCVRRMAGDSNRPGFVQRPQCAIAAADGAVAVDEPSRKFRNVDANGAAVTVAREHAWRGAPNC